MIESKVSPSHVSLNKITSQLNHSQTPQAIVCALAQSDITSLIKFDYVSLVLPDCEGKGLRIWRATCSTASERLAAAATMFAEAHSLLTRALAGGTSKVFAEGELSVDQTNQFGAEAKSALALPLAFGGHTFGLICFSSHEAEAYTSEDMLSFNWLADHLAAASQAVLLRSRVETLADAQREIDRLKSGFINTLMRDIRLPLTSVLGLLELFESKLQERESFDLEDRQLLGSALENGDRMRRLLDDHLEVARQQEPLFLQPEKILVAPMLEGLVEPLRGEAALRGVEINIQMTDPQLELQVDAKQTRRALSHVLTAALAATPDGGAVNIEAQGITGTRIGDDGRRFIILNIADTGAGLSAEETPFVFDAFWQAHGSNHSSRVHGVGLAIARRIAAAHGGNVTVRSQLGMGTVYSMTLPASASLAPSNKQRVLVVDDVPDIMLLMGKLVERMGYQVMTASCAAEALSVLESKEIDLLITDWAMPGMSGGELITTLKQDERWRSIPSIILTGHDTSAEREAALMAGCDCFLVKPVKRDDLQRAINKLLSTVPVLQ